MFTLYFLLLEKKKFPLLNKKVFKNNKIAIKEKFQQKKQMKFKVISKTNTSTTPCFLNVEVSKKQIVKLSSVFNKIKTTKLFLVNRL